MKEMRLLTIPLAVLYILLANKPLENKQKKHHHISTVAKATQN
jgi:hypothetical protein